MQSFIGIFITFAYHKGESASAHPVIQANYYKKTTMEEQILVGITGQDRPGLTAQVMEILSQHDAKILDIGQADIH